MQELNTIEIEAVAGGISKIEWIAIIDGVTDFFSGFVQGAKDGYGQQ